MTAPNLLAAVDLGSNSFRLLIGRIEKGKLGEQVLPLDSLKEPVRIGAGLDAKGNITVEAQERALATLNRFGERLRSFSPDAVCAVGTNTLRTAGNARHFLVTAEAALGFPIEVIAGGEEARLIYLGAAHALPHDDVDRLVVDIGGGSTELIIGRNYKPTLLESASVGCVSLSARWFPSGEVSRTSFERAYYASRDALAPIAVKYREQGWQYAVGTSGSAKAMVQAAQLNFGADSLTREGLLQIERAIVKAGSADRARLAGLRTDRRPVFAGGLAVMSAVFDELGVEEISYCPGALRQGVLYDLLGRTAGSDMREITVANMISRYGVLEAHSQRVANTALALFDQAARGAAEEVSRRRRLLGWSAMLADIGTSISHPDFHKHSAYILTHADMPGFSESEKLAMSNLVLGHVGGLRKMRDLVADELEWLMVLSMRVSAILHRRRDNAQVPLPSLWFRRGKIRLEVPSQWAARHPLSDDTLATEAETWPELGLCQEFVYRKI